MEEKYFYKHRVFIFIGVAFIVLVTASVLLLRFGVKQKPVAHAPAHSLSASVYNSQTHPQDFYLAVNTAPSGFSAGKLIEINGQTYTPYFYWQNDNYWRIDWKSKNGVQSVFIYKHQPLAELYENVGYGLELKASAVPDFEYYQNEWQKYQLDFSSAELSGNMADDAAHLSLNFLARDNFGNEIPSSMDLSLGFNGQNYINEWIFKLGQNEKINRFAWNVVKDKPTLLALSKENKSFYNLKPERQVALSNKKAGSLFSAVSGMISGGDKSINEESSAEVSVQDFINQNNGRKDLVKQDGDRHIFYPNGQMGELVIDPTLSATTSASTITVQTSGVSTNDFKLVFTAASGGVDEGYIGTGAAWSTNYLSSANMLTQLSQDAATQVGTASTLTLLVATSTKTVIRNAFTLTNEATVVEDWTIYPTGKIVKHINYNKTNSNGGAGTETRSENTSGFILSGGTGYNANVTPATDRAIGVYDYSQIIRLNVNTASTNPLSEVAEFKTPDTDIGVLKGGSWNEDATGTDEFITWDGSYGVKLVATDTAAYIADYDPGYTGAQPVFKISGWTSTSTPNYVALNGTTLTQGTDYNISLNPIAYSYYATNTGSVATTTLASGGDNSVSTEYFASSTNNFAMPFSAATDYLYIGFLNSSTTNINIDLARNGVGGTLSWAYCSAVNANGNCSTWSSLAVQSTVSGASNMTAPGSVYWASSASANWATSTANTIGGVPSLYYLRVYLNTGSYTTSPKENLITTGILTFQYINTNLAATNNSFAIAYANKVSVASGDISSASVWSPSGVPSATDSLLISNGNTVILSTSTATASVSIKDLFIANGGTFRLASTTPATVALTLTAQGSIIVSGVLDVQGPPRDALNYSAADTAATIKIYNQTNCLTDICLDGIIVEGSGTMTMRGSTNIDVDVYTRTARLAVTSNPSYVYLKSGSETLIENASVAGYGSGGGVTIPAANYRKRAFYAENVNGGTINEGLVVTGSIFSSAQTGAMYLSSSTNLIIANNRFISNLSNGQQTAQIIIATSTNITLYGNTIWGNTGASRLGGVVLVNGDNNQIINNTIYGMLGTTDVGLNIDSASDSNVIKNNIISTNTTGLTDNGTNNTISYNLFYGNGSNSTTGNNAVTSNPLFFNSLGPDGSTSTDDNLALAKNSPALGAGIRPDGTVTNSYTNIGASLGYVKNITNATKDKFGLLGDATSTVAAGDTVTTYTVDSASSTIANMTDMGEFLKITAASSVVTADNQYIGQYVYLTSGANKNLYYLIVDSAENGSSDTLTIDASSTTGFALGDSFTIIDRVYSQPAASLINFFSGAYAGRSILDLNGIQGSSGLPITWNTSGTVLLDLQSKLAYGISGAWSGSGTNSAYNTIDGFKIMNGAESGGTNYTAGIFFGNGANNIIIKNTDVYLMGGTIKNSGGGNGVVFYHADGTTAPSNIILENVNAFANTGSGIIINATNTSSYRAKNINLKNVNSFSNFGYGINLWGTENAVIQGGNFYSNNLALGSGAGNYFQNATSTLIDGAKFYNNKGTAGTVQGGSGIYFDASARSTVINSSFFGNSGNGIGVAVANGVHNDTFKNNLFFANGRSGIRIQADSDNIVVSNNTFDANKEYGFWINCTAATDPDNTTSTNNLFTNNSLFGYSEWNGGNTSTCGANNIANYNYYALNNNGSAANSSSTNGEVNSFATTTGGVNPNYIAEDSGTAEAGSTSSLTDTDKNWVTNQWIGYALKITAGTGYSASAIATNTVAIIANSTSTLTLAPTLPAALDATTQYQITGYFISSTSTATATTTFGTGQDPITFKKTGNINIGARAGLIQNTTDSIYSNSLQAANDTAGLSSGDNLWIVAKTATSTTISSATSTNNDLASIWITVPNNIIMVNGQFNGMYLYIASATATYANRYFPIISSSSTEGVFVIPRDVVQGTSISAANFAANTPIQIVDRVYNKINYTNGNTTANVRLTKSGTFSSPISWNASTTGPVIIDAGYNWYASSTYAIYGDGAKYNTFTGTTTDLILRGAASYDVAASSTATTRLVFQNTQMMDANEVATVTTSTTSYILSQKHDATAGLTNLWGAYALESGTWWLNYASSTYQNANDANVAKSLRFMQAGDSVTTTAGSTINLNGISTATTTVDRGSGNTGVNAFEINGAINAQYYSFKYLNDNGLKINSGATVGNLNNGLYDYIGTSGRTSSSTAILLDTGIIGSNTTITSGAIFANSGSTLDNYASTTGNAVSGWWYFSGTNGEAHDGADADPGTLIWQDSSPAAPTIGAATSTSSTTLKVNFTDNAINETGFSLTDSSGAVATTSATANLSSLTATSLTPNKSYTYYARADNTNASPAVYATSSSAGLYTLANAPTAAAFSSVTSTSSIILNWGANSNNTGTTYVAHNQTSDSYVTTTSGTSAAFNNLTDNTAYTFRVRAQNGNGFYTDWTSLGSTTTIENVNTPSAPTLSDASTNSVKLVVNQNGNIATIQYAIFESGSKQYVQANGTLGAALVWQTYSLWGGGSGITITGLSSGTYTFGVKAQNSSGSVTTGFSSESAVTLSSGGRRIIPTDQPPTTAPLAPLVQNPQALVIGKIRWNFKDNSDNESGFRLKDSTGKILISSISSDLSYIDESGLLPNTKYSGRQVFAFNDIGESAGSGALPSIYTLAATPNAPTVQVLSDTSIKLIIDANKNPDYTQFLIKENNNLKYVDKIGGLDSWVTWQTLKDWGGAKGIIITGLNPGEEYSFVLKARNEEGQETDLSTANTFVAKDIVPPAAPLINYPINNAILRSNQFTVSGTTEPSAQISIKLDGQDLGFVATGDENGIFAYDLPKALADGSHAIEIKAKDLSNNISPSAKVVFTVKLKKEGDIEPTASVNNSRYSLSQSSLKVDGSSILTISVLDKDGLPLAGHQIKVLSSGLDDDIITGRVSKTFREVANIKGQAEFSIYSKVAHKAVLSIYDETDDLLLFNNIALTFNADDPYFIIIGSNRYLLGAKSIFSSNDTAEIKVHLEDKLRNIISDSREIKLSLEPQLGSLSAYSLKTQNGYATVSYFAPGGDQLPAPINRVTIGVVSGGLSGQITVIITRPPTPKEEKDQKEQEQVLVVKRDAYEAAKEIAIDKGLPIPPLPAELKKPAIPLPDGIAVASAAGTIDLSPDEKGRISVVAGQSFEVTFKPKAGKAPSSVSLFALDKEYAFTDKNHDGILETTLSFGKEEKGKEITMLIVEKYANGNVKVSPLSALIDPYGYVFTKVNTDSKHPLVMNAEQRIENVRVLLYWYNVKTKNWEKWPAKNYFQENPMFSNKQGEYSFMVPAGDYYLTAYRDGFEMYRSKRVTVENGKPVNLNIFLATKYTPVEKLQNILNLVGIETNLPDYVLYLLLALVCIMLLGVPLVVWLTFKVVRQREQAKFQAKL